MALRFVALLCALLPLLHVAAAFNVELQHDLGGGSFSRAGSLTVKQGAGQAKGRAGRLVLSRGLLSEEERAGFERLVRDDGFYRVKVPGAAQKLDAASDVVASVRARCLVHAGFKEVLVLHVDSAERIFSMDYGLGGGPPCRPGLPADLPASWAFAPVVEVAVRKAAPAPVVDVPKPQLKDAAAAEALYDLEEAGEGELSEDGQRKRKGKEEPKSFMERNWMLLVFGGMLVMNVLGSLAPPEGPPGAGGARRAAR